MSPTFEKIEALRRTYTEGAQQALNEGFQQLFAAHPTLKAVRWTQYTPHFNDGEPCVFHMHEARYLVEGVAADAGDYGDGFIGRYDRAELATVPGVAAVVEAAEKFTNGLREFQDLLREMLGDHLRVTVTATGVTLEEFEHD
jgi:hypothetical protein